MKRETLPYAPGWAETTLSEILTVIRGVSYKKEHSSNVPGAGLLPILRATNIQNGLVFENLVYVPKDCVSEGQMLRPGDIVIAASSGSRNIVGKAAQLTREWHGSWGVFCFGLRPNKSVDAHFLACFLQTSEYRHHVSELSAGVNINNLQSKHIEETPIPLPPLPEQHRIVAKIEELFTRLDAGTAALKKVKAELKRYRQAVLKYAFEGELTAAWREANKDKIKPASVLLARIKEERRKAVREKYKEILLPDVSDLHELPEGWLWASSSEVCASVRDGTHDTPKYVEVGIPLITSKNLKENGLDFSTAKNISTEDHQKISLRSGVEAGDILFAMIGTIGNPVVVKTGRVFSIKNVALFKKNTPFIFSEYLKYWFEGLVFNKLLEKKKYLKGTTQRFIPLEYLRILPIPLCNYQEQRQIIEEIERRLSVADEVEKVVEQSRRQSERLRQSILKKAFAGKLVLQDPSDEPAEKLLERIKAEKAKHDAEVKGKKASKKKSSTKQGRLK